MNSSWMWALFACVLLAMAVPDASAEPADLFKTKCSSCHTYGKGEKVGPDLKGLSDRHSREWLIAWIKSSEKVIRSGDPTGVALFRQFRQQRMPDHDLPDAEIGALVDYLSAGGPETDAQKALRRANSATDDEVKIGEQLFYGRAKLSEGGLACAACHSLSTHSRLGGTLAPDLSRAFPRYYDTALDRTLRATSRASASPLHATGVTEVESFALRAFLRVVSLNGRPAADALASSDPAAARRR